MQYSCDAGFRLRGDSSALCTASGVWSVGAPASCQRAVCPPAEAPTDGSVTPIYPSDEELDDGFDSSKDSSFNRDVILVLLRIDLVDMLLGGVSDNQTIHHIASS